MYLVIYSGRKAISFFITFPRHSDVSFMSIFNYTFLVFREMVAYIANTLIFILSGVVIADGVLENNVHFERHGIYLHVPFEIYLLCFQ
jgi:hypothetical protein